MRSATCLVLILVASAQATPADGQPPTPQNQAPTWEVQPSVTKLVTAFATSVGLRVTVAKGSAEAQVSLLASSLQNATTGAQLPLKCWNLPEKTTVDDGEVTALNLSLDLNEPGCGATGVYTGSIWLASSVADAAPKELKLTVETSTQERRWAGVGLIAIGLGLTLLTTVALRHRAQSLALMLPATLLGEAIGRFQAELEQALAAVKGAQVPRVSAQIATWQGELSSERLEAKGFVPGLWRTLVPTGGDAAGKYQAFLDAISARLAIFRLVLDQGILPSLAASGGQDLPSRLKSLDDLAVKEPADLAATAAAIPGILTTKSPDGGGGRPSRLPPLESQLFELRLLAFGAWLVWLLVSVVSGYAALIAGNYGFGIETDLLKCFLWGLGLPLAGEQLRQLTSTQVTTQLKLTLPA